MIRSVAVQRIQDGLGFRTDRADEIILRLQEEQRDLERGKSLPAFMRASASLILLTATAEISLPTDFLRITGERPLYFTPDFTAWHQLPWRSIRELKLHNDYTGSGLVGAPTVIALDLTGDRVVFDKVSDLAYPVYIAYFRAADLLTSDIENVWLENAPELLIGGAGRRIAADMRNKTAFELFDAMWKQSRASWFNEAVLEDIDESGPLVLGANS